MAKWSTVINVSKKWSFNAHGVPCQFLGDSITLYSNSYPNKIPDHAIIFDEKLMQIVGCGRSNYASTCADYAGFWVPVENGKGKVDRVPTIIERLCFQEKME